jgi:prepilin-type N-terminal cleavage/methylation domain-containing protein/prepilin-type processing-associated H-X9-DG protein
VKVKTCREGFTLIELLVVIAIIVVLAGLILPALAKAKSSARRVECLSRMKQWGLGFQSYADDNEGVMPREGFHSTGQVWWNNWNQIRNNQSQDVWYNALSNHVNMPPAASYGSATARLSFYDRSSFFHCPSSRFPGSANTPTFQIALFSIAMNSQLIEPPDVPTGHISRIIRPSNTVLFLDNLLEGESRVVDQQAWDELGQPASMASRFASVRHGKGGNLVFADGSGRWFAGHQVVETQGQNRGGIIWPESEIAWHLPTP